MVWGVVADRASYNQAAIREVSQLWGGRMQIAGPAIHIPVTRTQTRTIEDEFGGEQTITNEIEGDPVILLPDRSETTIDATSQIRSRGIFDVPVYAARINIKASFSSDQSYNLKEDERLRPEDAQMILVLPGRRAFFGETKMMINGKAATPEPGTGLSNISGIRVPTPLTGGEITADLSFGLNGAQSLSTRPLARDSILRITSDWPDPSFDGAFLPEEREITETGFTAKWQVPHLALNVPQISRGAGVLFPTGHAGTFSDISAFGVRFVEELDFYQLVERAVKYGFLFIALTFLTLFLLESISKSPVHPAQFLLIGLAECVFFLLLLSLAEQIGFTPAYLAASAATIALLGYYGLTALQLARKVWILVALLILLYAVLFVVLQSSDYALLIGAFLSFGAVATTMIATRNERWYREAR